MVMGLLRSCCDGFASMCALLCSMCVCVCDGFALLWPVLEVEGVREEKEVKKRNSKKRNKKEHLNKMGKK